jgi:plasmid stabilization system protein ParE
MPRGSKSKYTSKQKRQAEHIAGGYSNRGTSRKESKSRAWATVNKMTGGGKRSGSGRGKAVNKSAARKGGRIGGSRAKSRTRSRR